MVQQTTCMYVHYTYMYMYMYTCKFCLCVCTLHIYTHVHVYYMYLYESSLSSALVASQHHIVPKGQVEVHNACHTGQLWCGDKAAELHGGGLLHFADGVVLKGMLLEVQAVVKHGTFLREQYGYWHGIDLITSKYIKSRPLTVLYMYVYTYIVKV